MRENSGCTSRDPKPCTMFPHGGDVELRAFTMALFITGVRVRASLEMSWKAAWTFSPRFDAAVKPASDMIEELVGKSSPRAKIIRRSCRPRSDYGRQRGNIMIGKIVLAFGLSAIIIGIMAAPDIKRLH
jgi:hypothetical protein